VTEYSDLPPRERAKKYRALASDARKEASYIKDRKAKEDYVIIAEGWDEMAAGIKRSLARGKKGESD
jgi:hypothetical protein